jgi:hypothetical protein
MTCDDRGIFHNYQEFDHYDTHLVGYCNRCKEKTVARIGSDQESELFIRDLIQPTSKWFWFEMGKCDQSANTNLKKFAKASPWYVPEMKLRDGTFREEFQEITEEFEHERYL